MDDSLTLLKPLRSLSQRYNSLLVSISSVPLSNAHSTLERNVDSATRVCDQQLCVLPYLLLLHKIEGTGVKFDHISILRCKRQDERDHTGHYSRNSYC